MLSSEQLPKWQACVEQLTSSVGFSEEDAERLLAKGHGWTSRAYWGAERVRGNGPRANLPCYLPCLLLTVGFM